MEEKPALSFNHALDEVYNGFGIYGFAKIVQEKEKAMYKFWQNRIFHYVLDYFQLPKILGTLLLTILLFSLLHYRMILPIYVYYSFPVIGLLGIIWFGYKNYAQDTKIRDYLYVRSYYGIVGTVFYFVFYLPTIIQIDEFTWMENIYAQLGLSLAIVMGVILSFVCFYRIPIELNKEFCNRFGHYLSE